MKPPVFMRWGADAGTAELQAKLDAANEALATAEARVTAAEAAHARCAAMIGELHARNTSLVQLTVASQLLSAGSDRDQVLDAIEEIVINMIGSEEIAIFELLPHETRVRLTRTRGIDGATARFASALGPIREAIATGRVVVPPGREIAAVVPLTMDTTTLGVVAVFRLLEQKPQLDPRDHELLDLLRRQGAVAMFSAALRSSKPSLRPAQKNAP